MRFMTLVCEHFQPMSNAVIERKRDFLVFHIRISLAATVMQGLLNA